MFVRIFVNIFAENRGKGKSSDANVRFSLHLQNVVFSDAHQNRADSHEKDRFTPKLVAKRRNGDADHRLSFRLRRHVISAKFFAQFRKEKTDETADPLETEEDHGENAQPGVKRVEILSGWVSVIMIVKNCFQADRGEDEWQR